MEATQERQSPREGRVKLTMEIDEPLHRALKTEASRRGKSMREYISALIERGHHEETEKAE